MTNADQIAALRRVLRTQRDSEESLRSLAGGSLPNIGDSIVALEPAVYQSLRAWIMRYPRLARHMGEIK